MQDPAPTRPHPVDGCAIRRTIIIEGMHDEPHDQRPQQGLPRTWNDPARIEVHRRLSPSARIRLTIEASQAALRFASGRRLDEH
jgi:hypothetical protein